MFQFMQNAIISPFFDFIQLPIVYVLFKIGYPPIALAWVEALACVILGIVIKPILVHVIVKYSYKDIMLMILRCMIVTGLSLIAPILLIRFFDVNLIVGFLVILAVSLTSVGGIIWYVGIDNQMKRLLISWTMNKLSIIKMNEKDEP